MGGASVPSALHFRKPVDRAPAEVGRRARHTTTRRAAAAAVAGPKPVAPSRDLPAPASAQSTLTQASACSKSRSRNAGRRPGRRLRAGVRSDAPRAPVGPSQRHSSLAHASLPRPRRPARRPCSRCRGPTRHEILRTMARAKTRSVLRTALSVTERAHLLRTRPWRITDAADIAESRADRSIEIRCEAAEALGRLLCNRRRAPSALLQAATDRNSLVRTCVAEALGDIGDKAAAAVLDGYCETPRRGALVAACSLAMGPDLKQAGRFAERWSRRDRSSLARVGHYEALASTVNAITELCRVSPIAALREPKAACAGST